MGRRGFTLIELIVVMSIIGVLAVAALPYYREWKANTEYRKATREIASVLRLARSKAISNNREHDVVFNLTDNTYKLRRGSRATDTPTGQWRVVYNGLAVSESVNLKGYKNCSKEDDEPFMFHFNPNGSSSIKYICILDSSANKKFLVGMPRPTSGKIVILSWNGVDWE